MELLNTSFDLDQFFARLAESSYPLLMLDYDGTLAPFRPERDEAIPYSGVRERLARLVASVRTRTVLVSGRAVDDLVPLLGLPQLPEIWGSHGAERRLPDGSREAVDLSPSIRTGLVQIEQWAVRNNFDDSLERKPAALAFHWRKLPADSAATLKQAVLAAWSETVGRFGLHLREFDGGLEVRPADTTKAIAIHSLLHATPADTLAAYLGDDLTDEDAFGAMVDHGLSVLVRKEKRSTLADLWLVPPADLLAFLDRWLEVAE
jgi:trehalose-phosphatase